MLRLTAVLLLTLACSAAAPRAAQSCNGPVSCGREQLIEADQALLHAIQRQGTAKALSDAALEDVKLLAERRGVVSGKENVAAAVRPLPPLTWTMARADVSADAQLGYSFGWMAKGHYASVWRRREGEWKVAVFLHKPAESQNAAPPSWFAPFRGEREKAAQAAYTVDATDSAFAAYARKAGTQVAFTAYAAQDAVQLARTMVFGRDAIHQLFAGAPAVQWGPIASDAAQDLGWTIGAWTIGEQRGNYLTVWSLQSDGSWRYILDGGVNG
jgi:hypothetical protein